MTKKKVTTTTVTEYFDDNDDDILINILLDRSGSMSSYESEVIGHYNRYIEEQRALPGKARVSLVLFDDRYEEVYLNKNIQDVPKLTADVYNVRGMTAYYDALGKLINSVEQLKDRPNKVVFVINTDGFENASHEFNASKVKELITKHQSKDNWQFSFIGAGIDAISEAKKMGIVLNSVYAAASPSLGGIGDSYSNLGRTTTNYRTGQTLTMDNALAQTQLDEEDKKKKKVTTK